MQDKISQKSDLPKNGKVTLEKRIESIEKVLPEIIDMLKKLIDIQLTEVKKKKQKTG